CAVWTKHHVVYPITMPSQREAARLPRFAIPHNDGLVVTARRQQCAIGAKHGTSHPCPRHMGLERRFKPSMLGNIPEGNGVLLVAHGERVPVRTKGDTHDSVSMLCAVEKLMRRAIPQHQVPITTP